MAGASLARSDRFFPESLELFTEFCAQALCSRWKEPLDLFQAAEPLGQKIPKTPVGLKASVLQVWTSADTLTRRYALLRI